MRGTLLVTTWLLCMSLPDVVVSMRQTSTEKARAYAEAVAAFQDRLEQYLNLRGEVTESIPEVTETGDPTKITAREEALGRAIAKARGTAGPGDLFGPVAPYVADILIEDWTSRSPADRQALFSELPQGITLTVDHRYPPELPLLTVPAALLAKLPTLPEEVEYRLINRHLLLRDRDANVVLDVLFDVIPR